MQSAGNKLFDFVNTRAVASTRTQAGLDPQLSSSGRQTEMAALTDLEGQAAVPAALTTPTGTSCTELEHLDEAVPPEASTSERFLLMQQERIQTLETDVSGLEERVGLLEGESKEAKARRAQKAQRAAEEQAAEATVAAVAAAPPGAAPVAMNVPAAVVRDPWAAMLQLPGQWRVFKAAVMLALFMRGAASVVGSIAMVVSPCMLLFAGIALAVHQKKLGQINTPGLATVTSIANATAELAAFGQGNSGSSSCSLDIFYIARYIDGTTSFDVTDVNITFSSYGQQRLNPLQGCPMSMIGRVLPLCYSYLHPERYELAQCDAWSYGQASRATRDDTIVLLVAVGFIGASFAFMCIACFFLGVAKLLRQ